MFEFVYPILHIFLKIIDHLNLPKFHLSLDVSTANLILYFI